MPGKKIEIELKGMHVDDEHLLLEEFASELTAISEALKNVERITIKRSKPTIAYRIIELSHASPVKVTLEAQPIGLNEDYSNEVVNSFFSGLNDIVQRERVPSDFDHQTLEAFKGIGRKIKKSISHLVISTNGHSCNIAEDFQSKIQIIQGADELTKGSITGKIEAINIHSGANEFRIYPSVGPPKVKCCFPKRLINEAVAAVNKYVVVYGKVKYKTRSNYPFEIDIDNIEVLPSARERTKLSDLHGIEPDLTGGLSPEEFVRKLRDSDDEQ